MLSVKKISEKRFKRQWTAKTVICLITSINIQYLRGHFKGQELYSQNTNKILLIHRRKKFPIPP